MALFINGVGQDTFSMNGVAIDNLYVDGVLVWTSIPEVATIPRYELTEALVDASTVDDSNNTLDTYNGLLTESDGTTTYEPTELQYPGNGLLELASGRIMNTQLNVDALADTYGLYGIYDADGSTTYKIWAVDMSGYIYGDLYEGDQDTPLSLTGTIELNLIDNPYTITDGRPAWMPSLVPTPDMLFKFEDNLLDDTGTYTGGDGGGVAYQDGIIGRALTCNGTSTLVTHNMTGSPLRSVAVWARPDVSKDRNFVSVWDDASSVYVDLDNVVASAYTPTQALSQSSNATITIGEWVHIVALFTDDSTVPTLYIDGVLQTPQQHNDFWSIATGNNYIATSGANYFNGAIDEHSVYLRHLTQEEITALYEQGSPA